MNSRSFPPSRHRPRWQYHICGSAAAALAAAALTLSGCAATSSSASNDSAGNGVHVDGSASSTGVRGDRLSQPVTLSPASSAAVFAATSGRSTTLAALQRGRLMLLYFGYTHCPDVCPTTMADIGVALRDVPAQIRTHTQVVFITSDPARDTTSVMKAWLAHFDPGLPVPFVGLTASTGQIDRVAASVGVPLAPPVTDRNGTVSVQHGAQVLAFTGGKASVVWLAGTSSDDYTHDITQLAQNVGTP